MHFISRAYIINTQWIFILNQLFDSVSSRGFSSKFGAPTLDFELLSLSLIFLLFLLQHLLAMTSHRTLVKSIRQIEPTITLKMTTPSDPMLVAETLWSATLILLRLWAEVFCLSTVSSFFSFSTFSSIVSSESVTFVALEHGHSQRILEVVPRTEISSVVSSAIVSVSVSSVVCCVVVCSDVIFTCSVVSCCVVVSAHKSVTVAWLFGV